MRKLLFVVLVLGLLAAVVPYGLGFQAEKKVNKIAKQITEDSYGKVSISVTDYQRGWLNSQANLQVKFTPDPAAAKYLDDDILEFTIKQNIQHGPLLKIKEEGGKKSKYKLGVALVGYIIPLNAEQQQAVDGWFADQKTKPQPYTSMLINFDGSSSVNMQVSAFDYVSKKLSGKLEWLGMRGSWNISSNMESVSAALDFKGANIYLPQATVVVGNLSVHGDQRTANYGLKVGSGQLNLPKLKVSIDDKERFNLKKLSIKASSNVDEKFYATNLLAEVEKFVVEGQSYGPGTLKLEFNKMNAPKLAAFGESVRKANADSELQRRLIGLSLLPQLVEVLSYGANYTQELHMQLPIGKLDFNVNGAFAEQEKVKQDKSSFAFLRNLIIKADLSVTKAFVEDMLLRYYQSDDGIAEIALTQSKQFAGSNDGQDNPQQTAALVATNKELASAIKSGWLRDEGDDLLLNMEVKNGQLKVNGKIMSSLPGAAKQ